jgi:hypothetical protein
MRILLLPMASVLLVLGALSLYWGIDETDGNLNSNMLWGGVAIFGGIMLVIIVVIEHIQDVDTWHVTLPPGILELSQISEEMESLLDSREYDFKNHRRKEYWSRHKEDGVYSHSFEIQYPGVPKLAIILKQRLYHSKGEESKGAIWLEILNITKENIHQAETLHKDLSSLVER